MKSNVNLSIEIAHDDDLGATAQEIAGRVARFLAADFGLSPGILFIMEGDRRGICGPVEVTVQSAVISRRR